MEKYNLRFQSENTQQPSQKLKTNHSYILFSKGKTTLLDSTKFFKFET